MRTGRVPRCQPHLCFSSLIYPFMPATSDSILTQLNAPARVVPDVLSTDILAGHHIGKPEHLFKKHHERPIGYFLPYKVTPTKLIYSLFCGEKIQKNHSTWVKI
jgi:hypothetical protein